MLKCFVEFEPRYRLQKDTNITENSSEPCSCLSFTGGNPVTGLLVACNPSSSWGTGASRHRMKRLLGCYSPLLEPWQTEVVEEPKGECLQRCNYLCWHKGYNLHSASSQAHWLHWKLSANFDNSAEVLLHNRDEIDKTRKRRLKWVGVCETHY